MDRSKENKWRNRDWIWLFVVTIMSFIFICSILLRNNNELSNIFSYIASGISIVLAIVAIVFAIIQNSYTQELNGRMSETLKAMQMDLSHVNNRLGELNINKIMEYNQEIVQLTKNIENKDKDEIIKDANKIAEKVQESNEEISKAFKIDTLKTISKSKMLANLALLSALYDYDTININDTNKN